MALQQHLSDLKKSLNFNHISDDTRSLNSGDLFVLDVRNNPNKANELIEQALTMGAHVVANTEREGVIYHEAPSKLLAEYYSEKHPKQPGKMVGITGTNGKTSTAYFYKALMSVVGKSASLGTIGLAVDNETKYTGFTTPTAKILHPLLQKLAEDDVSHLAMEVSSHALALNRIDAVKFDAACFTNLSQDHLDFHESMDDYFLTKAKLFTEHLKEGAIACINVNLQEGLILAANCKERDIQVMTYGLGSAEVVVTPLEVHNKGMRVVVKVDTFNQEFDLPLIGAFQAVNLAGALALALSTGLKLADIPKAMAEVKAVDGRMDLVETPKDKAAVVVDYAHTPAALEVALKASRKHTKGKLWCLFGAGGDRDKTKRPLMGKAAEELADMVIVTDDNPRSEDPAKIREDIMVTCPKATNIAGREEAIAYALKNAQADDLILVAGKGHETEPFKDADKVKEFL